MIIGAEKTELQELPRIKERLSFIYLEYCNINRSDSGISASNSRGVVDIPIASIATLVLGPGTTITHRAIELIGEVGSTIIWAGEKGIRYYAHGRPLTHSSKMLEKQARLVSNTRSRLAVARKMYQMRFPGEDVSKLTMQQLRGREGSRIRSVYRTLSKETGVEWNGRDYNPEDYYGSDPINRALSSSNACLYGAVQCAIVALGCSPGLGFVHTGHERSFVYDIADLYKTEISIPASFRMVASSPDNLDRAVRKATRDLISTMHIMERVVEDIRILFSETTEDDPQSDEVALWDSSGNLPSGKSYGEDK